MTCIALEQPIDVLAMTDKIHDLAVSYFKNNLPNESAVIGFGKTITTRNGRTKIIVTDIVVPQDSDYVTRTPVLCELSIEFIGKNIIKFAKQGKAFVIFFHWHPRFGLSSIDMVDGHMPMLRGGYKYCLTGYNFRDKTQFYKYENNKFSEVTLRIVDTKRFDRQLRAYGYENQLMLSSSKILVVGCGGGSFPLIHYCALMGFEEITVADPDNFTEDSLNRVWIPHKFIGQNKAITMKSILEEFAQINAYPCKGEELSDEVFDDVDIILVFTDSITSRLNINDIAVQKHIPCVFLGSEIRADSNGKITAMAGDCLVYDGSDSSPCFGCNLLMNPDQMQKETLDPQKWKHYAKKYGLEGNVNPVPSLVGLNSLVSTLGADSVVRLLTGYARLVHHQYIDLLNKRFPIIVVNEEKRPDCPYCSPIDNTRLDVKMVDVLKKMFRQNENKTDVKSESLQKQNQESNQ